MLTGILFPAILITALAVGLFVWYRRRMDAMKPDTARAVSGVRLTAERCRTLPSPPWRVVYEIGSDRLDDIDHVVIGPAGVIAIQTVLADRPVPAPVDDTPARVARSAIARASLDEALAPVGATCDALVKVFWGTPRPDEPAGHEVTTKEWAVEGQRLDAWLAEHAQPTSNPTRIDQLWQTVTLGIGRPDPLG
ncbi:MAG: hypothetical protein AAFP84_16275 [Actinomycetota bacterium]